MRTLDLGTLDGPLLFFGGPYSNLQASEALLKEAKELGFTSDRMICTGDLTAYCAHPSETSILFKEFGCHIIQGNCEESLASDGDDCGCGYGEDSECAKLSAYWYELAKIETPRALKDWMGSLPHRLEFTYHGKRVHVLHGSHSSINEFIFPSSDVTKKMGDLHSIGADIVVAGHSGIPFTQVIDDLVWHNAGVIGLPANDGTSRTWFSTLDVTSGMITFSHHALTYNFETAAAAMEKYGLYDYAKTLKTGIYPTFDSLAEVEKSQTGVPLVERSVIISKEMVTAAA